MPYTRPRQVCRAHDAFSPTIALWLHFVAPVLPVRQQRLSSTVAKKVQSPDSHNGNTSKDTSVSYKETDGETIHAVSDQAGSGSSETAGSIAASEPEGQAGAPTTGITIRRMTTVKGRWIPDKTVSSILKKQHRRQAEVQLAAHAQIRKAIAAKAAFQAGEDYIGTIVEPRPGLRPKDEQPVWCVRQGEWPEHGMQRLVMEIDRFYQYAIPGTDEKISRKTVIEQVRKHVQSALPECELEVFGSERTGLASATADIDLRLILPPIGLDAAADKISPRRNDKERFKEQFQKLFNRTLRHEKAYTRVLMRHARYPLIDLLDRESGLDVQIVLARDSAHSRAIMQRYMDEYPYLRSLYFVVKAMFEVRGLSEVYHGGFGAYSIFMMIVASVKHAPWPPQDAGYALLNFLKFYGTFDTVNKGISIEPPVLFDKATERIERPEVTAKIKKEGMLKPLPPYLLSLRDPADEYNDLGRQGATIKHVQATLADLFNDLLKQVKWNTRYTLLDTIVGATDVLNHERRKKLRAYGKQATDKIRLQADELWNPSQQTNDVEDLETAAKQVELETELGAEEEKQRAEERDREVQRLTEERQQRLQAEAGRLSKSDYGEAISSILEMPVATEDNDQPSSEHAKQSDTP